MRGAAIDAGLVRTEAFASKKNLRDPRALDSNPECASSRALVPETRRIVLVSDPFHLPRSWVIFRVMGWPDGGAPCRP